MHENIIIGLPVSDGWALDKSGLPVNPFELTPDEIASWTPRVQAIGKLHDAHFATFNAMEATRTKRQRARLLKGLGVLWRAAAYIREESNNHA